MVLHLDRQKMRRSHKDGEITLLVVDHVVLDSGDKSMWCHPELEGHTLAGRTFLSPLRFTDKNLRSFLFQ